jgi:hypothetical protein
MGPVTKEQKCGGEMVRVAVGDHDVFDLGEGLVERSCAVNRRGPTVQQDLSVYQQAGG